jgi:hypothetical protein
MTNGCSRTAVEPVRPDRPVRPLAPNCRLVDSLVADACAALDAQEKDAIWHRLSNHRPVRAAEQPRRSLQRSKHWASHFAAVSCRADRRLATVLLRDLRKPFGIALRDLPDVRDVLPLEFAGRRSLRSLTISLNTAGDACRSLFHRTHRMHGTHYSAQLSDPLSRKFISCHIPASCSRTSAADTFF